MASELVIYTDESDKDGEFFANFYGGVLVRSTDLANVIAEIQQVKSEQHLFREIKWQRVTGNYLKKYMAVMDVFFDIVAADRAKVRIMFTNNQYVPRGLTSDQRQSAYHRLYYQFIKHAFGLIYCDEGKTGRIGIRLNLDQMPTNNEDTASFKGHVTGLNHNAAMQAAGIRFDKQQIAEVSSDDHVLMQCLDVVLGSMQFRLNNKHKIKPAGKSRRGKRTVAKEKLYNHIRQRIRDIYPNFNVGISTGTQGDIANRWRHPYRHWLLIPKDHIRDLSKAKP